MNDANSNVLREFAKMMESNAINTGKGQPRSVKAFKLTLPTPKAMFVYSSAIAVVFVAQPLAVALAFQKLVNGLGIFGPVGRALGRDQVSYRQAAAIAVPAWYLDRLLRTRAKVDTKAGK